MGGSNQLASQVIRVIESVPKINFHLGDLQITADGLGKVAYAIQKGDIKVELKASLSTDGLYDSAQDTLYLRSSNLDDVERKSLIVHEAVHALIDLLQAKDTRKLAGEATAYLAQAIYLRHEVNDTRFRQNVEERSNSANEQKRQLGRIYQACLNLIDKYNLEGRGTWLRPMFYQPLLEAIKGHTAYKDISWHQKVVADGIGARGAQAAVHTQVGGLHIPNARAQGPIGVRDTENPFGRGSSRNPGPTGIA